MKKLNKWISLLWKSHKKELELKKEIERLNCEILSKDTEISNERLITQSWKKKADDYRYELFEMRNKIQNDTLRFRIQKYTYNLTMNPYESTINQRLADDYFKRFVDDSKKKFVDELIEMNCIKEIDTDEYLEWQIAVKKD